VRFQAGLGVEFHLDVLSLDRYQLIVRQPGVKIVYPSIIRILKQLAEDWI
jgi:hypothetical protein